MRYFPHGELMTVKESSLTLGPSIGFLIPQRELPLIFTMKLRKNKKYGNLRAEFIGPQKLMMMKLSKQDWSL